MGLFKKIASAIGLSRDNMRILVVGLDNSGKSTLIEHIKPNKATTFEATPTVGFQVEEFAKNNLNFTIFDMSGQSRYRTLWEHYFCDVHAIIFVMDSTDRVRTCVAREELVEIIKHKEDHSSGDEVVVKTRLYDRSPRCIVPSRHVLWQVQSSNMPILVYANKGDLPGSMSPNECSDELGLGALDGSRTPWHIEKSNALTGAGVEEGVEWLIQTLTAKGRWRGGSERRRSSGSTHK